MSSLVALAAATTTYDIAAQVNVEGSGRFVGEADLEGDLAGLTYASTLHPAPLKLALEFSDARVRVLESPYAVVGSRPGNPNPGQTHATPVPEETFNQTGPGRVRLDFLQSNATWAILPRTVEGTLGLRFGGPAELTFAPRSNWEAIRGRSAFWPDVRPGHPMGPGAALQRNATTEAVATGATYAFLFGGTFVLEMGAQPPKTIVAGERWNESRSVLEPSGEMGVWWFDRTVLLLEGDDVRTRVGADAGAVQFAARTLRGTLAGDLALANVTGSVRVQDSSVEPRPELLQAIGSFDVAADYGNRGAGRWTFDGPATFVGVDGLAIVGDRLAHRWPPAAIVVTGAGLVALAAAFLTQLGRELLSLISGRNVARPLESDTRILFLREISRNPGLTLRDLAARAGITKWGAMHHVAVLKRASLIDEVRSGNASTFMLNRHSYRFRAKALDPAGMGDVKVANALAELGHPKRRLIKETLARRGPSHYAQLVAAWKEEGVPEPHPTPSDVTYHTTRMEAAGLLRRRREGPHVVWDLNLDFEAVRLHQWKAWMHDPVASAVVEAVRHRPGCEAREIARALGRSRRRRPLEAVRGVVRVLEEAGVLIPSGNGYRLADSVPLPAT